MKQRLVILIWSMLVLTGGTFAIPAPAIAAGETAVYLKVENFLWKEYRDSGAQILEESGPLLGLGLSGKWDVDQSMGARCLAEIFGGSVNYDGQTQGGTPAKTDTDYLGVKVEGDVGPKFMVAGQASFEPFVGIGYKWWKRSIKSTAAATGGDEIWSSIYARLGGRVELPFSEKMQVFAEAGMIMPVYNKNKVDLLDVTLEPGNAVSAFGEVGLKWLQLKASVFYEGMRFDKSDLVTKSGVIIWQPESKADIYGVKLGMAF